MCGVNGSSLRIMLVEIIGIIEDFCLFRSGDLGPSRWTLLTITRNQYVSMARRHSGVPFLVTYVTVRVQTFTQCRSRA